MRGQQLLAVVAGTALVGVQAGAVGGTLTDQAASLTLPASHWSGAPNADLSGVDTGDAVYRMGWWYRIHGVDTQEHPLPPPDIESYVGNAASFTWNNLGGSGIQLYEGLSVFDREGPSGGFVSSLAARKASGAPTTVSFFHYLDADLDNSFADDTVISVAPTFIELADPPSYGRYYAQAADHFECSVPSSPTSVINRLNDANPNDLLDSGPPFTGDVSCAFEMTRTVPTSSSYFTMGTVVYMANLPQRHLKGDVWPNGNPDIAFQDSGNNLVVWDMRRTSINTTVSYSEARRVVGVADFDGDLSDDFLTRDAVSHQVFVDGSPVSPILPGNWDVAATGDLSADGYADIVWRNSTSQKLVVWRMQGTTRLGAFTPVPDQAVDGNWAMVGAADMNNDGNRDFVWYNQTTGRTVIWTMDASVVRITGYFTTPNSVGSNVWKVVAVGDYGKGDGSERPAVLNGNDLVWQNDVSGKIVVWHLNFLSERTSGLFTTPDGLGAAYKVVGPR